MAAEATLPIEPMRILAARFCALVEAPGDDPAAFARAVGPVLAELIAAAMRLPEADATSHELPAGPSDADWDARRRAIGSVLAEWDGYWIVLEPLAADPDEPAYGSLSDDLADIWRDLKVGLVELETGAGELDAIWHWRFTFWSHWGRHAVEALLVLQRALADVSES